MRHRSLLVPLALVAAIFVPVCIGLYWFTKTKPLWRTTSPITQGGLEFMGVYKGIPDHLPIKGYTQRADLLPFTGDLWAYFRIDKQRQFEVTSSRIFGKGVAGDPKEGARIFTDNKPETKSVVVAVPVPSQYSPEMRNGTLALYNHGDQLGSWKLSGMPAANPAISKSEPDSLEGKAAGCRIRFAGPAIHEVWQNSGAAYPSGANWKIQFDVEVMKKQPEDCFEADFQLNRTTWNQVDDQGWQTKPLPAKHNAVTYERYNQTYEPADRVEVFAKVRRLRIQKDYVVLKDVVLAKAPPKSYRGYRLVSCQSANVVSSGGIRLSVIVSAAGFGTSEDMVGLTLGCREPLKSSVISASKLSRSLGQPIELSFAKTSSVMTIGLDSRFTFELTVPGSKRPPSIRLKELIVPFNQRAVLEEQTIPLLGPVKPVKK